MVFVVHSGFFAIQFFKAKLPTYHRKGAKDAKKTTLLWRLIPLNIFFAIFAPLR